MKFKDYRKTALKNLSRRKTRTFLTAFAVAIGTMLIVTMVSLGVGAQKLIIDTIKGETAITKVSVSPVRNQKGEIKDSTLGSKEEKKTMLLTKKNVDNLKGIQGVGSVVVDISAGYLDDVKVDNIQLKDTRVLTKGVDLNYHVFSKSDIDAMRIKADDKELNPIKYGEILTSKDIDKNVALIGEAVLKKQFPNEDLNNFIGKELNITVKPLVGENVPKELINIEAYNTKVKIVGVIDERLAEGNSMIIPIKIAGEIKGYERFEKDYLAKNGADSATVSVENVEDIEQIQKKIEKMGFEIFTMNFVIDWVNKGFKAINGFLSIGGIVVIFVATLGVINTMTMAIYERTRSIGIMKALGASKSTIRNLFLFESGAIGAIGGVMGIAFAWINTLILSVGVNIVLKSNELPQVKLFYIPFWLVLGALGFAICITIIAGIYPAYKASRLDPIDSLRYE